MLLSEVAAADGSSPKAHAVGSRVLVGPPDVIGLAPDLFRWPYSSMFITYADLTHQLERSLENAPPGHRIEIAGVVWNVQMEQFEGADETQFRAGAKSDIVVLRAASKIWLDFAEGTIYKS